MSKHIASTRSVGYLYFQTVDRVNFEKSIFFQLVEISRICGVKIVHKSLTLKRYILQKCTFKKYGIFILG